MNIEVEKLMQACVLEANLIKPEYCTADAKKLAIYKELEKQGIYVRFFEQTFTMPYSGLGIVNFRFVQTFAKLFRVRDDNVILMQTCEFGSISIKHACEKMSKNLPKIISNLQRVDKDAKKTSAKNKEQEK